MLRAFFYALETESETLMTLYVDEMRMSATVGRVTGRWSHLFSDVSTEELNEFANKLGLRPSWIQNTDGFIHYDVIDSKRNMAIILGAVACDWYDLASILANSYMRESPKVKALISLNANR